jgi:hypothetical protein
MNPPPPRAKACEDYLKYIKFKFKDFYEGIYFSPSF